MDNFPNKKYQIIYADPPWQYNDKRIIRKDGKSSKFSYGAYNHYKLMDLKTICKFPISNITDRNCVLFLWITPPLLNLAFQVISAWGFNYKTVGFFWVKLNKNAIIQRRQDIEKATFFGVSYYTKSNIELCLLALKGKIKPISNNISNVVYANREEHSKKPDIIRDKIVQLFGDLPRIEIFSRKYVVGWDFYGDEINKFSSTLI